MRLAVVGRDTDPLSAHTAEIARQLGHEPLAVSFAVGAALAGDADAWRVDGEALDACDALVIRRYPSLYAQLGPADETLTGAAQWKRTMQQVERASFAQSALMDLERRGVPMVNPLLASQPFDFKPLQLATLKRAGVPVPDTLVTNDAARVALFRAAAGGAGVIAKPAAGGAFAVLVDDATDLSALKDGPAIFQKRIHGDDVRVTVVGDRVVSSVIIESDGALDYRSGAAYAAGAAVYRAHALAPEVEALAVTCARLCGQVLSGVDMKRTAGGDYVVIEANSGPAYLDIERKTGAPITEAIIAWLASRVLARERGP